MTDGNNEQPKQRPPRVPRRHHTEAETDRQTLGEDRDTQGDDDEWEREQLSHEDFTDRRDETEEPPFVEHREPVGYKKPPKKNQFKPGQSGNPKGHRKAPVPVGLARAMAESLNKSEMVSRGGRRVRMSRTEILAERAVAAAMTGPVKDMKIVIEMLQRVGAYAVEEELKRIRDADEVRTNALLWTPEMEKRFQEIEADFFENVEPKPEPDDTRSAEERQAAERRRRA